MAKKEIKHPTEDFAFGKENYTIMLIGIAVIVLGFICMSGGPSKDPNVYDPDIFSFRRITCAHPGHCRLCDRDLRYPQKIERIVLISLLADVIIS